MYVRLVNDVARKTRTCNHIYTVGQRLHITSAPRWFSQRILTLKAVSSGTVLNSRTITQHKCGAVPRRARIQGSCTFVSLNSRLESNKEEGEKVSQRRKRIYTVVLERDTRTSSGKGVNGSKGGPQ